MSDIEINKTCAELMGKCFHDWEKAKVIEAGTYKCIHCRVRCCWDDTSTLRNFDPLNNPSDYVEFLLFCVNEWDRERWFEFLLQHGHYNYDFDSDGYEPGKNVDAFIDLDLFKTKRALPESVARYVKEGE